MAQENFKRKLTAILSADVEGYSRLMGEDEEATIRTLTTYRSAIAKLVQQYRGRVVDSPGDNILSEFTSAVDAVNCAVEIQRDLAERNAGLPHNRRMEFRIGVNVGDVVQEEERIYGDGVNIAARVESMSQAGGICIIGTHVWAEKYDGDLKDIFDLQDQITQQVVASLQTQIQLNIGENIRRLERPDIKTWELLARSWKLFYELTQESLSEAEKLLRIVPNATISGLHLPYKSLDDLNRFKGGLRKAGLPE
ncbi:MAG: adenylate/guanylate cyclase domain-containing protein [bacterium]|nr:adenylate/guanylate cyclase domain-containing protein [bacterium]